MPQTALRLLRDHEIAPTACATGSPTSTTTAASCGGRTSRCTSRPTTAATPARSRGCTGAPKDPDYFATRYQAEIYVNGFASRPYALSSVDTLWDPSRAPEGKHLVGLEEFAAPRRLFSRLGAS